MRRNGRVRFIHLYNRLNNNYMHFYENKQFRVISGQHKLIICLLKLNQCLFSMDVKKPLRVPFDQHRLNV